MNSIKKKLFIQIGGLVILLISLLILANTLLLESYNTYKQKRYLIEYYNIINEMDTTDYGDNLYTFIAIENASNVNILILSDTYNILYTSQAYLTLGPGRPPVDITKREAINDQIQFTWGIDPVLNEKSLILAGKLDNDNTIELNIPISSIETNIAVSNDFLLIIGAIIFVIAMFLAFIISNHFTKPILAMNAATEKMKHLDFEISCKVLSHDEIGQLSESINEMSIALADTIHSLNENNIHLQRKIQENNELQQKRRLLLNNVSHELKTPIALIQGYSEALKLNIFKNKEKVDFYCDVLIDESIKMNHLVESLLDIDQMEFDTNIFKKTIFNVNDFIIQTVHKYEKLFEDKKIKLNLHVETPITVYSDIFMTERVLTNYITNAIHYVDENLCININLYASSDTARIEVFNTTREIPDKELNKIWDSFYKLDKARTRENGGHGLGLSIVRAIQEGLHNEYGVKNVENGVVFWFEIDRYHN
jgi:signal transduction histidine kinase